MLQMITYKCPFPGLRRESEQTEADIGHTVAQPRQARGLPHQVPH